ncbi:hypothetical protein [Paludibacter jiangxiensis]|nr:hypothetical protein [Paludibacter jiangxiensis]
MIYKRITQISIPNELQKGQNQAITEKQIGRDFGLRLISPLTQTPE